MKHQRALFLAAALAWLLGGTAAVRAADDEAAVFPAQLRWIWYPEGQPARSAPAGIRYFRAAVILPTNTAFTCAQLIINADDT